MNELTLSLSSVSPYHKSTHSHPHPPICIHLTKETPKIATMSSHLSNPSQWTTGADPPTEKQTAFLATLTPNAQLNPAEMTKSEVSQKIDELKSPSNNAPSQPTAPSSKEGGGGGGGGGGARGGSEGGGAAAPPIRDPKEWTTGGDPATGKQTGYIAAMAREAGEEVQTEGMGKSEASERIGELKGKTGM